MFGNSKRCWMCKRISDELTEHHIIPQVLEDYIETKGKTVDLCKSCHEKIHLLLPVFSEDGSYRWKGTKKWEFVFPGGMDDGKDKKVKDK